MYTSHTLDKVSDDVAILVDKLESSKNSLTKFISLYFHDGGILLDKSTGRSLKRADLMVALTLLCKAIEACEVKKEVQA